MLTTLDPFEATRTAWHLFSVAAQASVEAYNNDAIKRSVMSTPANPRAGTKAMLGRGEQHSHRSVIVIAIRGSGWNLSDWNVNLRREPTLPTIPFNDEDNPCHAGFLQVARSMVFPVAITIRRILAQSSSTPHTLLLTGHSAGGAIASLLYTHIRSRRSSSTLTTLAPFFKRIHCITFGTPPISLVPLQKPSHSATDKDMFITFINDGDIVTKIDSWEALASILRALQLGKRRRRRCLWANLVEHSSSPPATFYIPGRSVLLRPVPVLEHMIEAVQISNHELRSMNDTRISAHLMELYKRRIDAVGAG